MTSFNSCIFYACVKVKILNLRLLSFCSPTPIGDSKNIQNLGISFIQFNVLLENIKFSKKNRQYYWELIDKTELQILK